MKPLHAAITAAKKVTAWGEFAAFRYAMKHGATVDQYWAARRYEEKRLTRQRIRAYCEGYLA